MGKDNEVGITRYSKIEEILDCLIGAWGGNRAIPYQSTQDLRNL